MVGKIQVEVVVKVVVVVMIMMMIVITKLSYFRGKTNREEEDILLVSFLLFCFIEKAH